MTMLPLLLCGIWVIAANVCVVLPSERERWPVAIVLITTGIPLLGLVTWLFGPVAGLIAFGAGAAILRWPVRLTIARLRRRDAPAERQAQPAE